MEARAVLCLRRRFATDEPVFQIVIPGLQGNPLTTASGQRRRFECSGHVQGQPGICGSCPFTKCSNK